MEVAIEHEKRVRVREVDQLQAQLRQREVELQKAKLNLDRDTDARRTAEAPNADLASKRAEQAQQSTCIHDVLCHGNSLEPESHCIRQELLHESMITNVQYRTPINTTRYFNNYIHPHPL